jgi:geranylgeranyl pyrophosphate synthase
MIHAFSLVHDDMPCMDDDDMRRGKPSTHKAFGEAEALLCGDELFCLAFEVASSNEKVDAKTAQRVIREFAHGAGALGMAGGQHYDLCELPSDYGELVRLHKMKTGALIAASCINGYYTACPEPDGKVCDDIREFAYSIGLAFQIIDDVLDVVSDPATLGKPIGSDAEQGKVTSLSFMSIDEAREEAAKLTEKAKAAIAKYPETGTLCDFADYLLKRIY